MYDVICLVNRSVKREDTKEIFLAVLISMSSLIWVHTVCYRDVWKGPTNTPTPDYIYSRLAAVVLGYLEVNAEIDMHILQVRGAQKEQNKRGGNVFTI